MAKPIHYSQLVDPKLGSRSTLAGHLAVVTPGESIRIYGEAEKTTWSDDLGATTELVTFDKTFRVGNPCRVSNSRVLTLYGIILRITSKRITIREGSNTDVRMTIREFAQLNGVPP
jgi:hypothetical protein